MLGPSMAQKHPCEPNSAGISEIITWATSLHHTGRVGANSFYTIQCIFFYDSYKILQSSK